MSQGKSIEARCRWLASRNDLYRKQYKEFREILRSRSGYAFPIAGWTEAECKEFLDFAKVVPHLRSPY